MQTSILFMKYIREHFLALPKMSAKYIYHCWKDLVVVQRLDNSRWEESILSRKMWVIKNRCSDVWLNERFECFPKFWER